VVMEILRIPLFLFIIFVMVYGGKVIRWMFNNEYENRINNNLRIIEEDQMGFWSCDG
jgi:hypothetical protein